MEYYSAYYMVTLKDILLNETSQSQEDQYCVIPLI